MKMLPYWIMACLLAGPAYATDEAALQHAADFATKAAIANMFELEAAKVEIAKGKAEGARQFAQDMLNDHGRAGPALADAAKQDGVTIPSDLDEEHKQKVAALAQSDPANLDQAYLSTQITAHEQAVALFANFSKDGPDGQLKRTAAKLLPALKMHLTRVQALTSK